MSERVLKLSVPTLYFWLAMFYALFDLWLNIVGELTQFCGEHTASGGGARVGHTAARPPHAPHARAACAHRIALPQHPSRQRLRLCPRAPHPLLSS